MGTVTKKNLIDQVSNLTGHNRHDVKHVIQTFLAEMISELGQGNRLEFRDFGVFEIRRRAPRVAQNPKTLAPVTVPPRNTVKFKVGRLMKERLDDVALDVLAPEREGDGHNGSGEVQVTQTLHRRSRQRISK